MTRSASRFGLATAIAAALLTAPAPAGAVTLNPGDILVADDAAGGDFNGAVIRIDAAGNQEIVSSMGNFVNPADLMLTPDGRILVVDRDGPTDQGSVISVDPATGAQAVLSQDGIFNNPRGIARHPDGTLLVINLGPDPEDNGLLRVDPATGAQSVLSSEAANGFFDDPSAVVVDQTGANIYVSDEDATPSFHGGVARVDPATGAVTIVADNPSGPTGFDFNDPQDLAFGPPGQLYVIDEDAHLDPSMSDQRGVLFRVPLDTGVETRLSAGGNFVNPTGVAVDLAGFPIVGDVSAFPGEFVGAVIRVDPTSGAQSVLARQGELVGSNAIRPLVVPPKCQGLYPTIVGTNGRDVLQGSPFADVILARGGKDTIRSGGGNDRVCAGKGKDKAKGGTGRDRLKGQKGADDLAGGKGRDLLKGGPGDDELKGGKGRDKLRGGKGDDDEDE